MTGINNLFLILIRQINRQTTTTKTTICQSYCFFVITIYIYITKTLDSQITAYIV